ncbi:trichohyalin-like [Oncorhynchus masou masou]|uniref:trichohyalin-like n=1 Tax=Oncorhynchus masou masou TaxID=90313 RepID=UPI0031831BB3
MGCQSQYFEHFKSQLQHKFGLARDDEQGLQTRVHQLERHVLEMSVSSSTNIATVNAASVNYPVMVPTVHRVQRLAHPREERKEENGEGEEENTQWRRYGQHLQQKQGEDEIEIEEEREGERESVRERGVRTDGAASSSASRRTSGLLEKEEQGLEERRGLLEKLQDAQQNGHFLSSKVEEMRTVVNRLKLNESSMTEEVEELQEENQRL